MRIAKTSLVRFVGGATCRRNWIRWDAYCRTPIRSWTSQAMWPKPRVACTVAVSAPTSCTSPSPTAANGSRIAWRIRRRTPDRAQILERILRAELFEEVLHSRYPGTKRFSLEGVTALIPLLDQILESASEHGAEELMLAMSHRGRLNVMVHIAGKSPVEIFAGFEDVDPRSALGGGDVKYHIGATGEYRTRRGLTMHVQLVSNPSHLEAVDPVALGRARARQIRAGERGQARILPLLIHGDAAFAGQGIWAETLNYADLDGFTVGGTVHVIVNNLIGFTATPNQLHSSRFAADVAKRQAVPIFHVNGEDPEAVVRVGQMAAEYRYTFGSDVVVDLIGYRRHGHSEVDDPTVSQPKLYRAIKSTLRCGRCLRKKPASTSRTSDARSSPNSTPRKLTRRR